MNLLDPILRQVRAHPQHVAIINDGKSMSYRELWARVEMVSLRLHEEGIRRGDCVAASGLIPRGRLILYMALARIGASSIGVQATRPRATRDLLFTQSKAVAWVTRETVEDEGAAPRRIAPEALLNAESEGQVPEMASGLQDEVWRIALSSGTTGTTKCIPWTHGENARAQHLGVAVYPSGPRELLMIAVDVNINFALGHAVRHLASGGSLVLPQSLDPADIALSIRRDRPTRILSTPSVIGAFAAYLETVPAGGGFESLLSVILGGGVIVPKLRAQLEKQLCPNIIVIYGSTEMASTARGDSALALEFPNATGRLLPWMEAQALDEQGKPLPAGETGTLRFRSPAMATHYLGNPEATAAAFRDGWYYPGDKGSIDATGVLTLGGRTDDVLNLSGLKIDPAPIEAVIDAHAAVRESAVTAYRSPEGNDVLALFLVTARGLQKEDEVSINEQLRDVAGVRYQHIRIVTVDALPRTPVGKLARSKLPALATAAHAIAK